ncbi:hypothetical protein B0H13DRAFT_1888613 [Mycena leptocephala]|nr:hypothetical protein B0H13DRAFT_1888613 [Mycena leptocephala]
MRWISILTFSRSEDAAPPFNSLSLNPRSPDVDPTFPSVETVTTTDSLDGFIFVNTFTFTLNPSVETYTASYTGTFDLVAVTGVDVFHLTVPTTSAQPLSRTFTQSTIQTSTIFTQSANIDDLDAQRNSSGAEPHTTAIDNLHAKHYSDIDDIDDLDAEQQSNNVFLSTPFLREETPCPVIAGGVVGAFLALGHLRCYFTSYDAALNEGEMAPGPPAEKEAQIVAVPDEPVTSTGSEQSGEVGTIQAERDPSLLAEQIRVLKAQLQAALQAQDNAPDSVARVPSTATDAPVPGPSATHSPSTMKRERTGLRTVRNYEPVDLLVHTDSGIDLDRAKPLRSSPRCMLRGNHLWDKLYYSPQSAGPCFFGSKIQRSGG